MRFCPDSSWFEKFLSEEGGMVESGLEDAISDYECEFNEGNYEVNDWIGWTSKDEHRLVRRWLDSRKVRFILESPKEKAAPEGLPSLVHVFAMVHLLERGIPESYAELRGHPLPWFAEAGMPCPTLMLLDSLRRTLYRPAFGLMVLETAVDATHSIQFGSLGRYALDVADWDRRRLKGADEPFPSRPNDLTCFERLSLDLMDSLLDRNVAERTPRTNSSH